MHEISNISVSEATVTEPVTLQEVKDWLQIDFADFDDLLTSMIKGARQAIENYLNLSLVTKSVTLDVEVKCSNEDYGSVYLPYTKGVSGLVVNELDSEDESTTLASGDDYFIRHNRLRIGPGRYDIAYTTVPGTINEDLKQAIKAEVAERFKSRGETESGKGLSEVAQALAAPYQIVWL